jgi:hypothetical protein
MLTTYERGRIEGQREERRQLATLMLEAKFGPLSPDAKQRLEALSPEQLAQLLLDFAKGQSLKELHLED